MCITPPLPHRHANLDRCGVPDRSPQVLHTFEFMPDSPGASWLGALFQGLCYESERTILGLAGAKLAG